MRAFKYVVMAFVAVFLMVGLSSLNAQAGYADNPTIVNYTMANQAYAVPDDFTKNGLTKAKIMKQLTSQVNEQAQGNKNSTKYKVIDIVSTNVKDGHEMGRLKTGKVQLDKAGLNALTVVAPGSKKLWIGIAGTKSYNDKKTALVAATQESRSGQELQLMLYINYIYNTYPEYRGYKWYLTGHSLGGNLAVQTYMNTRAGYTSDSKFKHGGAFKHKFSGVYTFNALPITKGKVTKTQWDANFKGTYNQDVFNYVIKDEWLHAYSNASNYLKTQDKIRTAYIGTLKTYNASTKTKVENAAKTAKNFAISYKHKSLTAIIADAYLYNDLAVLHGRGELNKSIGTKYYGAEEKMTSVK